MRHIKIVERLGETYSYAAVDQKTGEIPLRLPGRATLIALCGRLGWAVHEEFEVRQPSMRAQHAAAGTKTPDDLVAHDCIRIRFSSGTYVPWRFRVKRREGPAYVRRFTTVMVAAMPRSKSCLPPAPILCRSTSPICRRSPRRRGSFGLAGLNARCSTGVRGTTAVHICFGYAAIIHQRPDGCSFLSELAELPVQQVSIETAQSKLDCSVLQKLPGKTIILGTLDLSDMTVGKTRDRRRPHPPCAAVCAGAADCSRARLRAETMQARPEKARKFGLAGLNAALDGVRGTTAVHICFGYAAIIHQRPDVPEIPEFTGSRFQRARPNPRECRRFSHTRKSHSVDRTGWLGWEGSNSQMSLPKLAFEVWPEFPFHFGTFSDQRLFPAAIPLRTRPDNRLG